MRSDIAITRKVITRGARPAGLLISTSSKKFKRDLRTFLGVLPPASVSVQLKIQGHARIHDHGRAIGAWRSSLRDNIRYMRDSRLSQTVQIIFYFIRASKTDEAQVSWKDLSLFGSREVPI
jgi:hypothetical protein